jgi:hypothetical protein
VRCWDRSDKGKRIKFNRSNASYRYKYGYL